MRKVSNENLKITEDNPNENIFKKQSPVFYINSVVKYFTNS